MTHFCFGIFYVASLWFGNISFQFFSISFCSLIIVNQILHYHKKICNFNFKNSEPVHLQGTTLKNRETVLIRRLRYFKRCQPTLQNRMQYQLVSLKKKNKKPKTNPKTSLLQLSYKEQSGLIVSRDSIPGF